MSPRFWSTCPPPLIFRRHGSRLGGKLISMITMSDSKYAPLSCSRITFWTTMTLKPHAHGTFLANATHVSPLLLILPLTPDLTIKWLQSFIGKLYTSYVSYYLRHHSFFPVSCLCKVIITVTILEQKDEPCSLSDKINNLHSICFHPQSWLNHMHSMRGHPC